MAYTRQYIFDSVCDVVKYCEPLRKNGSSIVTTNGCFDILHAGHIEYLSEAASLGDILIVGINSDNSVRKLKGDLRPVQSQYDRRNIIQALSMVDCAFIFDEDDPRDFISRIQPDIHVKGGDYTQNIIEKATVEKGGGCVKILSFKSGVSTTAIIKKMIH